ncbi:MAG TPA: thioesterase family protein [Polyangium sp.]|nr:thioesterase family protein [Polyangium sp.]
MASSSEREQPRAELATSRMPLRVRFCETDLMGIVHHANYLIYFEAGRVDWLHRRGVRYENWVAMDVHLPVVDAALKFRKPAKFDESLVVETICAKVTVVTVLFTYRILREEDLLCEGETLLACIGINMRPKRFPKDVMDTFLRGEDGAS